MSDPISLTNQIKQGYENIFAEIKRNSPDENGSDVYKNALNAIKKVAEQLNEERKQNAITVESDQSVISNIPKKTKAISVSTDDKYLNIFKEALGEESLKEIKSFYLSSALNSWKYEHTNDTLVKVKIGEQIDIEMPQELMVNTLGFLAVQDLPIVALVSQQLNCLSDIARKEVSTLDLSRYKNLTDEDIQDIIVAFPNLKTLTFNSNQNVTSKGFEYVANLKKLESISIVDQNNQSITDDHLKSLEPLSLKSLTISNATHITDAGVAYIDKSRLELLDLSGCNKITDKIFSSLKLLSLQTLNLSFIESSSDDKLKELVEAFPNLKVLTFDCNRNVTPKGFKYIAGLKNLESININDPMKTVTDDHLKSLEKVSLKSLTISNSTHITDAGIAYIDKSKLELLNLSGCHNITDDSLAFFASREKSPLRVLSLDGLDKITDKGLGHLHNLSLEDLGVQNCKITDEGFIANINVSRLKSIRFKSNQEVTSKILEHLKNAPLESLELNRCHSIDKSDLNHLKSLAQLKSLDLSENNLSQIGLEIMEELKLDTLTVENCSLRDEDLKSLAKSTIKALDLARSTEITDVGVSYLKDLTQLKDLSLISCSITDTFLEYIKEMSSLKSLLLAGCSKLTEKTYEGLMEIASKRALDFKF